MKTQETFNLFKRIELFNGLNDDELKFIFENLSEKNLKENEALFKEGEARGEIYIIFRGKVELFKKTVYGEEKRIAVFGKLDFIGEGSLMEDSPHSTNARATEPTLILSLSAKVIKSDGHIAVTIFSNIARVISRRMRNANIRNLNHSAQYESGQTRKEHDLLGWRDVPCEAYYGIQTMRALENFNISGVTLSFFPTYIEALAIIKKGAALANHELGLLPTEIKDAICKACDEVITGKFNSHFVVDMIQGGAGTSTNMNANEVIANRAIELLGHVRGEYQYCHPNNHVNMSQSTNDAYPSAIKLAILTSNDSLICTLKELVGSFRKKADEFKDIIKMGRTQLQDAVPMTLGQSFEVMASTLEEEIERLHNNADLFLELNMGGTAIGTGINADPEYPDTVIKHLSNITGRKLKNAENLVEETQDTGGYIMYSSAVKRLSVKLSKICNDLRLMASGPRCGLNEINLPPMQPGSSIMPGKVNPVIPEVVNQIAFKVFGNDLTVTFAAEAGQLELNVMEPVIVQSIFESVEMLKNGMDTLRLRCVDGITANVQRCRDYVENSIGLVTALNPYIGYENSTMVAKEALESGKSVYQLVLEKNLLSKEKLDEILKPENMIKPHKTYN